MPVEAETRCFFQIGTPALISSTSREHAANASARCRPVDQALRPKVLHM
jgi:hypothetical protein